MAYVIAAYAIVIGSLCFYALRIQAQRRRLMKRDGHDPDDSRTG